ERADAAREARVARLLSEMTLQQKAGQLIVADIGGTTPHDLRHYPLGSTLNGSSCAPGNNEFAPPSEWLRLADRFYEASPGPSHGRTPIPMIWRADAVHGHNNLPGATILPHNVALGAAHDPELIRLTGEITAQGARATDRTIGVTHATLQLTPQQVAVHRGEGRKSLFAYGYGLTY